MADSKPKTNPNDQEEYQNDSDLFISVLSNVSQETLAKLDQDILSSLHKIDESPAEAIGPLNNQSYDQSMNLHTMFDSSNNDEQSKLTDITEIENDDNSNAAVEMSENGMKLEAEIIQNETGTSQSKLLDDQDLTEILVALQNNPKCREKWVNYSQAKFLFGTKEKSSIKSLLTKQELCVCLQTMQGLDKGIDIHFCYSWTKEKLIDLFFTCLTTTLPISSSNNTKCKRRRKRTPDELKNLWKKVIRCFPKKVMNAIVAEHKFGLKIISWKQNSPFLPPTNLANYGNIMWFSKLEYNKETLAYIFSFLDIHHLITNCRIKVCRDGFPERGIRKQAWAAVTKSNITNLKMPHVEDLIDKQSDSIAQLTFSLNVERCIRSLGFENEAYFYSLIREFYEAEDEPGIPSFERCIRRLKLREWLLEGVDFYTFPPPGTHIKGIPNVMFQGFLTNIERRIQIYPYVRSGSYNARSLGSLEAENLFGEFQDQDPKGSGVIKAVEVPNALETGCQFMKTQLMPNRTVHMTLTRAKVYPVHSLHNNVKLQTNCPFVYPSEVSSIVTRDHMFDSETSAKRKAQRKIASIADPDSAAKGVAPIRQYHKCDESKILPLRRLGIELS